MASVIWVDSDAEDDVIEIIETKPLAGPSTIANTPRQRDKLKRPRPQSPDSDIEFIEAIPKVAKISKPKPVTDHADDDHAIALALQKKWEEEDELARKQAADTEEKSLRLIARLQEMDQKMAEKRQKLAQSANVPDDGIVFQVVIDAQGNTIEGDDDPDNAAHLALVKQDFEQALAAGLKVKTVQWFVNAKLETRFEEAKAHLNSLGIDTTERNLFHGTAAPNIQPIVQNGFLIPGVSPGIQMAHGAACGVGIYLATNPQTSLGYTQGASRMFMCRVITGRSTATVSQAVPAPLGQNGYESWTQPGGGVYVVKYVELVVPRYVVEFESNMALQNYGIVMPRFPVAFAPPFPAPLPPPLGGFGLGFGAGPAVPPHLAGACPC
ncbi:ADP-ribosylation [Mycena sanguinolenta]|uniref:ADP-ribosylation n=1 Tax=Mycena sanguinolenta TaxID=230812 RepID=A0A8H7CKA6_9AGAR|nr:ADP-ribosylation [Mycena sanguinolenta]